MKLAGVTPLRAGGRGATRTARSTGIRLPGERFIRDAEACSGHECRRITWLYPCQEPLHGASRHVGERNPRDDAEESEQHSLAHDHLHDRPPSCAEGHPHADLVFPLRHGECQKPMDTDRPQQ